MKKFSKNYLAYKLVINLFSALILSLAIVSVFFDEASEVKFQTKIIVFVISYFVIYISLTIYSLLYFNTAMYEFKDTEIVETKGVLFKKKSILEYKKIHTVNKKQNIIQKLFGVSVLLIDSGSANTAFSAEITVFEDDSTCDLLMKQVKSIQSGQTKNCQEECSDEKVEEKTNLYEFTSKRRFLFSGIITITTAFSLFIGSILIIFAYLIICYFIEQARTNKIIPILLTSLFIYLGLNFLVFLISSFKSFIGYHDFKLYRNDDVIDVEYGLFQRIKNSFQVSKIKAVKIEQSLIHRVFGYGCIRVEVIGYGEENSNVIGVLIPLCKMNEINDILQRTLPEFKVNPNQNHPKSIIPFMTWTSLTMLIVMSVCLIPMFVIKHYDNEYNSFKPILFIWLLVIVVLFIFIFIKALLSKRVNGINIGDDEITCYSGSFAKNISLIKKKNIVGIEDITTPARKKKGIYTYRIHMYTNAMTNVITVSMLDEELSKKLINCINF